MILKQLNLPFSFQKQNALLESPTGTGKTLSLLCSILAWVDHKKYLSLQSDPSPAPSVPDNVESIDWDAVLSPREKPDNPKKPRSKENPIRVIYSSRTHSQLNQACTELKNSYYKYCPSVTIGSRDQLCINPEVMNLESMAAKNQACRQKVKNNLCKFHNNYEKKVSDLGFNGMHVYDIEDMVKFGSEFNACPYYMAKAKSDFNTSLIFMPYNYVLDPSIRRTLKLNLENTIVIFDEGHNIERVCEDSMSTELKSESLAVFINTFDMALKSLDLLDRGLYEGTNEKDLADLNMRDVAKVKMCICDLEIELERLVKSNQSVDKNIHDTSEIFKVMDRAGLDYEKCGLVCSVCEKLVTFVMNTTTSMMVTTTVMALTAVCSFIEMVMPFSSVKSSDFMVFKEEFLVNYKLYTEMENDSYSGNNKNPWTKKKSQKGWIVHLWFVLLITWILHLNHFCSFLGA